MCVCVCVLEDVQVRSDTAIANLQISSFFFSSFFKEEQDVEDVVRKFGKRVKLNRMKTAALEANPTH